MKTVMWTLLAGGLVLAVPIHAQDAASLPPEVVEHGFADTILVNGNIVSMDDAGNNENVGNVYQALAIKKTRILALGTNERIRTLASRTTRVVDLNGRTVIPGIVDTHSHIYGVERWARDLNIPLPHFVGVPEADTVEETREGIQSALKEAVTKVKPGDWIVAGMMPNPKTGAREAPFWASERRLAHREFLDAATRQNPVLLRAGVRGFINSAALKLANETMNGYSDFILESMGPEAVRMGWLGTQEMAALDWEIFLGKQPVEKLAEGIRRTLETYAAVGWTTFSTRIPMPPIMSAFVYLQRNGQMPIRLGGHYETHRRAAPPAFTRAFYDQTGALWGLGDDYFWITGVASERWDSTGPEACLGKDMSAPKAIKDRERCPDPGTIWWDVLKTATLAGWRPAGVHGVGSHGVRLFLQMLDEVRKEKGLSVEDIRRLRPTVEHSTVLGTEPDVVAKLKEYGVIVSAGPIFLVEAKQLVRDYGPKLEPFVVPVKSLLDAGVKVVGQFEGSQAVGYYLWTLMTRRVGDTVLNAKEAMDRTRLLKMWTRWAADYVMREQHIGSLETGKLADLVVLDRDYFKVPMDDIRAIVPLMTLVGGKTVFLHRQLAQELGTPPVGYQSNNPRPWDVTRVPTGLADSNTASEPSKPSQP